MEEEEKIELKPANESIWYALATIAGEPKPLDWKITKKNRYYWNGFMRTLLSDDELNTLTDNDGNKISLDALTDDDKAIIRKALDRDIFKKLDTLDKRNPVHYFNVEWPEHIDFEGFVFAGDALFGGAMFLGTASFRQAIFIKDVDFSEVKFMGSADFSEAAFKENASFRQAIFIDSAEFGSAKFSEVESKGRADFFEAEFKDSTYFCRTKFNGSANFHKATFTGDINSLIGHVDFSKAIFTEYADFSETKFTDFANFSNTIFEKNADFSNTTFKKNADFSRARFAEHEENSTGKVDFRNVTFTADANFKAVTFTQNVFFKDVLFAGIADFSDAKFKQNADFKSATCKTTTDFTRTKFSNHPPQFFDAEVSEDTRWPQEENFLTPTHNGETTIEHINAYERLALMMSKLEKHHDRHMFFRLEMRVRRRLDVIKDVRPAIERKHPFLKKVMNIPFFAKPIEIIVKAPVIAMNWLYEKFCDYGYGFGRALGWWFGHIVLGTVFLFPYKMTMLATPTLANICTGIKLWGVAFATSFSNAHSFLGLHRGALKDVYAQSAAQVPFFNLIWGFQGLFGIMFLFFLILTVRNRFKMG
ncbi:MAG: pentapeptide repeat-containing protein [Robiginitomaculum sp.]|nr:pentapeptide repeat-containing protein [Robiginitomaculum sp.]